MTALTLLGGAFAVIISLAYSALLGGFTLSTLWGWFVVPVFALPPLGLMNAYGLSLIASALKTIPSNDNQGKSLGAIIGESMIKSTFLSILVLACGYVAKAFV